MPDQQTRLRFLYQQWFNQQASPQERQELFVLLNQVNATEQLSSLMKEAWLSFSTEQTNLNVEAIADKILTSHPGEVFLPITRLGHRVRKFPVQPNARRPLFQRGILKTLWFRPQASSYTRRNLWWIKYAAAIIVLFGTGAYLWNNYSNNKPSDTAIIKPSTIDIQPGGERAILKLADGSEIVLDSVVNGQLAIQSGKQIIKKNGEIIYQEAYSFPLEKEGHNGEEISYNTMATPKGGQYKLTLSDGTKVWLNAASSITYPTIFTKTTREVKITGEVYFEVKTNKEKPFIVKQLPRAVLPTGLSTEDKKNEFEIIVLGTSFNVNAYSDESFIKTSLIEGSIKIGNTLINPGQAYINGKIVTADIEQDIAWKNGFFSFKDATIPTVMRQLARWYNIEVEYRGKIPERKFNGQIWRNLTLTQVFKMLSVMQINYTMESKNKIIIHP